MNPQIFRAYDVRGVADVDLSDELAHDLGRAYGTVIRRDGGETVCLSRDCRTSGPRLHAAMLKGLLSTGLKVIDVGVGATPLLYFAVFHHDVDGGVQITGSHNPKDYNGFKMMRGKSSLYGEQIQRLRELIETQDFEVGGGSVVDQPIHPAYIDYVSANISLGDKPLKVVIDGGNGTGGPPASDLLKRLGVDFEGMYVPMDGDFPNHHPDPTVEENLEELKAQVLESKADVGVAYDGDADRIGVVDDTGRVIWGDRLMILLSRDILSRHPGATIVGEVKCSKTLYDDISARGGRPIMSKVGHSIIKERMKTEGALLAGEMSGHIFYKERWFGFDDAVYVTGRLLEILSRSDKSLSELLADVPETEVTPEIRLECPDSLKFDVVSAAIAHYKLSHEVVDIDGARVNFSTPVGDGWGLVRASNTQPVIVMRAEASTPEALKIIANDIADFVADTRVRLEVGQ